MKDSFDDVVIIIPAFNEAKVIYDVVLKVRKTFKHVVCVDDGSTDATASEIERANVYLLRHPINMGQGAALQTGIEFARTLPEARYFVTFDSDGQHRIEDAVNMIKALHQGNVDIVLGSRFLGKTIGMKRSKQIILKAAIIFSRLTTGLELTDTHNGLRAFNLHVAHVIDITLSDMRHASEILEIIASKELKYKEIPVTIEYTDYSKSKGQSIMNAVNIGIDTLVRKVLK